MMIQTASSSFLAVLLLVIMLFGNPVTSFPLVPHGIANRAANDPLLVAAPSKQRHPRSMTHLFSLSEEQIAETSSAELLVDRPPSNFLSDDNNIWESIASSIYNVTENPSQTQNFVQLISVLRVGVPSLAAAATAKLVYPSIALWLAALINDSGAFAVISQDSSQYIQNILTTSGLVFSLLVGQTYYFMYQQQEAIYLALYEEVTVAKSLLEQIGLVSQGRSTLYQRILQCMDLYVREDLQRFNDIEPAEMLSARPVDDPLEDILYLTSVGEPSVVYQTVRSLRQARSYRLGALQKKLPSIHMTLLWSLAAIVLCSFPLLGAGAQTIGGLGILTVQAWYLSFITFGIWLVLGVIEELQRPGESGAYNARTVLQVMVAGLEEELKLRLNGDFVPNTAGPTLDINRVGALSSPSAAALLPLGTAEEVIEGKSMQNKIVDVESEATTTSSSKTTSTESAADAGSSSLEEESTTTSGENNTKKKRGLRKRVKTWASELVQNSITKIK